MHEDERTRSPNRKRATAQEAFARPFLKWVGGKRQLVPELVRRAPASFGTYHEPFVGGGALFFHFFGGAEGPGGSRPGAVLSDGNLRLVRAYLGVRDDVEGVIERLRGFPHDKRFFLEMRQRDVDRGTSTDVAAWLIYLNKTAYNGLYRVNSRNVFNVPFGDYGNPNLCDESNLRASARALARAEVLHAPFETVLERARRGDFVYFDPPYVPLSASSSFTSYTSDGFRHADQVRLRDVALELKRRGVAVLLSNSSAPVVRELYAEGFRVESVMANRAVNSKADGRGAVQELLIA